jgi:hypothetical protein
MLRMKIDEVDLKFIKEFDNYLVTPSIPPLIVKVIFPLPGGHELHFGRL